MSYIRTDLFHKEKIVGEYYLVEDKNDGELTILWKYNDRYFLTGASHVIVKEKFNFITKLNLEKIKSKGE